MRGKAVALISRRAGEDGRNSVAGLTGHLRTRVSPFRSVLPGKQFALDDTAVSGVNEQFPDYWEARFQAWGYQVVDCIRHDIWNDDSVLWWLRQNIMVFAKSALTTGDGPFVGRGRTGPLSIVHTGVYLWKLNEAQAASKEYYRLFELMAAGKKVSVERGPNGELRVSTDPDAAS